VVYWHRLEKQAPPPVSFNEWKCVLIFILFYQSDGGLLNLPAVLGSSSAYGRKKKIFWYLDIWNVSYVRLGSAIKTLALFCYHHLHWNHVKRIPFLTMQSGGEKWLLKVCEPYSEFSISLNSFELKHHQIFTLVLQIHQENQINKRDSMLMVGFLFLFRKWNSVTYLWVAKTHRLTASLKSNGCKLTHCFTWYIKNWNLSKLDPHNRCVCIMVQISMRTLIKEFFITMEKVRKPSLKGLEH